MFILYSINKNYKNQQIFITFYNCVLTVIYPSALFSICIPSSGTGSSQNVLILAKGEPLPVLATPTYILT